MSSNSVLSLSILSIKKPMQNSLRLKCILSQNNTLNKNHNRSLKSLDQTNRVKQIIQTSEKIIPSRSTRNAIKLQLKALASPKYFKKQHLSAQNRLKLHQNKQNIKLPIIIDKSKVSINEEKPKKKHLLKSKKESSKKLATQPIDYHFKTIDEQASRVEDIKDSLLQILDSNNRKSITIEAQMDKLSELTKKSSTLRKNLRTIQEDMICFQLKKKLSKISEKSQFCLFQ